MRHSVSFTVFQVHLTYILFAKLRIFFDRIQAEQEPDSVSVNANVSKLPDISGPTAKQRPAGLTVRALTNAHVTKAEGNGRALHTPPEALHLPFLHPRVLIL